jgi:hypothetical protein
MEKKEVSGDIVILFLVVLLCNEQSVLSKENSLSLVEKIHQYSTIVLEYYTSANDNLNNLKFK